MRTTSSSTSSSDRASPGGWAAWTRRWAVASGLLAVGLWGGVAALDPYDTGRFALLRRAGVHAQGPRTADASRGRDPRFTGAIIGNSHVQLLSPEALRAATGIPFVSLAIPATGPAEQRAVLDYFVRHHRPAPRGLVLSIDGAWCTPDAVATPTQPFPFWLYDPSPVAYLAGLLRPNALEAALQRVLLVTGLSRRPAARPDGYDDYEASRLASPPRGRVIPLSEREPSTILNTTGRFPQMAALGDALARLPPETAVILLRPPVYATSLPDPGTVLARSEAACADALAAAAARGPRARVIDWRRAVPETRDPANFFDHTHYRGGVARLVERDVAGGFAQLGAVAGPREAGSPAAR